MVLRSVSHTLAYADIFEYPLTAREVHRYLTSVRASQEEVMRVLGNEPLFSRVGEYFTLRGREHVVETRKRRTQIAARLWVKAARYGRIIAMFPFVRMVAVTGSLAMSNTEEGKDVDFMVVTAPNRLWTIRALILLLARIARLEGIELCPNYLITTNALELKERSLYVAHELTQMVPLSGADMYQEIRRRNTWVEHYLPNASGAPPAPQNLNMTQTGSIFQKTAEFLFHLPFMDSFENWEMKRKIARLSREQSSSFESYFSADVCKGHVDRHGQNVVTALAVRSEEATQVATTEHA
jgi:hypothetical protein